MIDSLFASLMKIIQTEMYSYFVLIAIIIAMIVVLTRGSNLLVSEAIKLSSRHNISKTLIGATIISLGTSLPEFAISVTSATKGLPGLALGTVVGSIICNISLVLGITILVRPLKVNKEELKDPTKIHLISIVWLIASTFFYCIINSLNPFKLGSRLPQFFGFISLILLFLYLFFSIKKDKYTSKSDSPDKSQQGTVFIVIKMILGLLLIYLSSKILVPAIKEFAIKINISDIIISSTIIALGTSLPELITAIISVRKDQGEFIIGNLIGANIINVLFSIGAAVSITPIGLGLDKNFFIVQFPTLLFVLIVFNCELMLSKKKLTRPVGVVLLISYLATTVINYIVGI